ncbi:MAG TPA: hypothetical protein PLG60_09130, partial [Acidimicrobiales bacterium]|nr:hypothetical protein [Acidimicrobiales bacterium]
MTTNSADFTPVLLGTSGPPDRRGSWLPTGAMISTRIMELRKRRGLMAALVVVNIGIPSLFLLIRLISHAVAPHSYGPAGGTDVFTALVAGVMYVFGFIVAATLGCVAATSDLSDGMFRHLVITGRSRLALYIARIPAGLAIIVPMVLTGFVIVCAVCVFAAPTQLNYDGLKVPAGLTQTGFETWAVNHPKEVVCGLPYHGPIKVPCGIGPQGQVQTPPGINNLNNISSATLKADAVKIAAQDYHDYSQQFLKPSSGLMIKAGLWIELEAIIGFVVGLGLASLMGQRTIAVILMIVLEVILTPLFSHSAIPHLINVQRGLVGLATAHLEPSALPHVFGGGQGGVASLVPESIAASAIVII